MSRSVLLLLLYTTIGGLTPVFGRMAVLEVPGMLLGWGRFAVAGTLLWVTARAMGLRLPIQRNTIWALLGIGALCVPINQFAFLTGLRLANASHAGVFYALSPVLLFWGALFLRQTEFRWSLCVASGLAFAGAAAVTLSSGSGSGWSLAPEMLKGDALLFVAVLSWVAFTLASKPFVERHGAVVTLSSVFLLGSGLYAPLALTQIGAVDVSVITWRGVTGCLFLTLVTSYTNYLLWYLVISRYDVTRSSVIANANFLITVALGSVMLGEPINAAFLAGCVLTLGGIALVIRDHLLRKRLDRQEDSNRG